MSHGCHVDNSSSRCRVGPAVSAFGSASLAPFFVLLPFMLACLLSGLVINYFFSLSLLLSLFALTLAFILWSHVLLSTRDPPPGATRVGQKYAHTPWVQRLFEASSPARPIMRFISLSCRINERYQEGDLCQRMAYIIVCSTCKECKEG